MNLTIGVDFIYCNCKLRNLNRKNNKADPMVDFRYLQLFHKLILLLTIYRILFDQGCVQDGSG